MKKRSRLTVLGIIFLSSSILFTASTQTARALVFDTFETLVLSSFDTIETLILGLSDDIGTMADRIGVMADRILLMSDDIGAMSERIVHTEALIISGFSESGISSLILSPVEGALVTATTPIDITLSSPTTNYLLYISNNADMSGSTNALVQNNDTSVAWSRVANFATGTQLYIAIRTVGATASSDFSNTVMLNLQ